MPSKYDVLMFMILREQEQARERAEVLALIAKFQKRRDRAVA
jgi:hypothetical protein